MVIVRNRSKVLATSRLAFILAIVILGMGALAPAAFAMPAVQSQDDLHQLEMLSGKDFEIDFMSMMIGHHQMALEMAMLVPDRANHQEVKDAAQKIIADQTREIGEMTGWLTQWYNTAPKQDMMHGDMAAMMAKLESLRGDEFDKEFLMMMHMHHMGAIDMAKLVPDRATHQELKDLAHNIISTQTAEMEQFEGWLMSWYKLDMAGGHMPEGHTPGMPSTGVASGGGAGASLILGVVALAAALLTTGYWFRRRV